MQELVDKAMAKVARSEEIWKQKKAELVAGGRWSEVLY